MSAKQIKTYSEGYVNYGYVTGVKKWVFQTPIAEGGKGHEILLNCRGVVNAIKVARTINAGVKRSGYFDNLARANVRQILAKKSN